GYACWSSGGLETQMFTFWVLLAFYFSRHEADPPSLRHAGWALALAAMTRPEGLLVAAVLGIHRVAGTNIRERTGRRPSRDELLAIAIFLALWAPWFAWRWWYYGYPFPNTYYVKAAGPAVGDYDRRMTAAGLHYVGQFLRQSGLLVAAP